MIEVKDWKLESDPALVGEPGTSFQGKLVFPWGYGVVLANISRGAFAGTDLGNVIPPERVICQDEMVESVDAEAFQQRLWGMFGVTDIVRVMDLQQEQLARSGFVDRSRAALRAGTKAPSGSVPA